MDVALQTSKQVNSEIGCLYIQAGLCPGVVLDFPGPVLTLYPHHLHEFVNLGYSLEYWTPNGESLLVRSLQCHRVPRSHGHPCSECTSINTSSAVEKLRQRATDPLPPEPIQ